MIPAYYFEPARAAWVLYWTDTAGREVTSDCFPSRAALLARLRDVLGAAR